MILQVVYCNHRTADLGVREKLAFSSAEQCARAYRRLREEWPRSEVVLLSTCNRIEIYTAEEDPDAKPSPQAVARFLAEFHEVPLDDFVDDLLERTGTDAVRHLFEVAASLDSMVLGEPQIVAQVREAYRRAQEEEACGPLTHALFQAAIRVSGRVRTETRLAEGRVSIASVAVGDFGRSIFDRFDDKTVLVIGAGEMAEETVRYLHEAGTRRIEVVNRSRARADRLVAEWGATAYDWDRLDDRLAEADIVVGAAGGDQVLVDAERFRRVRARTGPKPVFLLDLGAPRIFEPAVRDVDDNVFLADIDHLERTCEENRRSRAKEVEVAGRIIDDEVARFVQAIHHRATGPIVKQLREEWQVTVQDELARLWGRLDHLAEPDRREVERSIERIINKLLHPPLEALREEARTGTPHGLVDALKRLFGLERG